MNQQEKLPQERNLGEMIFEIKEEVSNFISTRVDIFLSEFRETIQGWKTLVPLTAAALLLLGTAYLLLTLSLVALVAVAFWGNPYHWFFAFLIVGLVWVVIGAFLAYFVVVTYRKQGRFPKRSMGVLQADREWLQMEMKGHL
jgi:uncharacterized membrane protein YqjE